MENNHLIIMLGVIAICCSRLAKIMTNITKNNNTINILYSDSENVKDFRLKIERLKIILNNIIFFLGFALVIYGIVDIYI